MSQLPSELYYTETHEWVRVEEEDVVRVGITDHAQQLLGDLVYIELPEIEAGYKAGSECAVVESVKAASDVYAPVSGEIIEINENLGDHPGILNNDPYGEGWLFLMRISDPGEVDELLSSEDYENVMTEDE